MQGFSYPYITNPNNSMMKKIGLYLLLALVAAGSLGCDHNDYYDTGLRDEVEELRARVEQLETWCGNVNSQIGALQGLVSALEGMDFVTGVTPIVEGALTIGYTITFTKSGPITILNGKDGKDGDKGETGKDGITPVVGAAQDTDGQYYWTVKTGDADPVWMLDGGKKIPATGASPEVGVAEADGMLYWQIDGEWLLHDGQKVPATGPQGDAVFAKDGIDTSDPLNVTFTLADGQTKITLPRAAAVTVGFAEYELFYGSAGNDEIGLVLPETLKEGDYTAITATITGEHGVSADVATRAAGEKWGVKITKPTFSDGVVVPGSARVKVIPPANVRLAETALLRVSITDAKGNESAVTRPVKYFDGLIVESTAGGLSAVVTDPSVTSLAIVGDMKSDDFKYIRESLTALEVLDLSMTSLQAMPNRGLAFYGTPNTTLRRVSLPESAVAIEEAAFANCNALETIDLGYVRSIGKWAFEKCYALREVRLGDQLEMIDNSAFMDCSSLGAIDIPGSVETLGSWVFENCEKLETVILNEGFRNLSASTFYSCGVVSIRIPSTVTEIPDYSFQNCRKLERITLHDGIVSMGDAVFLNCQSLREFKVPAGVTVLPNNTFEACASLRFVTLHDGITHIGERAFAKCLNLGLNGERDAIVLPASLATLGTEVFLNCEALVSVDMSKTRLTEIPAYMFVGCRQMAYCWLPAGVERIGNMAFAQCEALSAISFPSTIKTLESNAFLLCKSLKQVNCKAPAPPAIAANTFDPNYKTGRMLVAPDQNAYKEWFAYFDRIVVSQ